MKSKFIIFLFALVCVIIVFNEDKPHKNQFASDTGGYYLYLPAIFIYHDIGKLSFYDKIDSQYNHPFDKNCTLYKNNTNDHLLNKYPAGVAVFEFPFFITAHLYCLITGQYQPDGYSLPYQLGGLFSNIFWVIVGLLFLRQVLNRYFNDNIVVLTILCIAFGTNLYAYSSFNIGMSHPYSFFLFSLLAYITNLIYSVPKHQSFNRLAGLLGLVLGMIFIVRPINIIVVLIPLLWLLQNPFNLKERFWFLTHHYKEVFLVLTGFFLVAFIQFYYWKYITGNWLVYSYTGERFDFLHPHILNGLFSFRKGWFLYTPLSFIGCLGFYFLWKKNARLMFPIALFLTIMIYAVFSWQQWWYGGSFGCRPLIESFVFLSFPLAAIIEHFYNSATKLKKTAFFSLLFCLVFLNIFQTYQYSMGLIHWDRMTKEYYFRVFGKTDFDRRQNENYLIRPENEYNFND